MKLKSIKTIVVLSGVFILTNCTKEPFDYRNKYIGIWSFKITNSGYNSTDSTEFNYTEVFEGEVKYGSEDDKVIIKFGGNSNQILDLEIDKKGQLSGFSQSNGDGEFKSKKELFAIRAIENDGSYTQVIRGEKK